MDEFLNSEKFEMMAREYNKKYNSISILQEKSFDKKQLENFFNNIYKLCFMIKSITNHKKFDETALKQNKLLNKMEEFEKKLQIVTKKAEKYITNQINNKMVSCKMLEIIDDYNNFKYFEDKELRCIFSLILEFLIDFYKKID